MREHTAPNIGPMQRRRRLIGGLILAAVTALVATLMIAWGAPSLMRAFVAIPAMGASLGLLQARAYTCVALAACGLSNLDAGNRRVTDEAERNAMRNQARRVYAQSLLLTLLVTGVVLAI